MQDNFEMDLLYRAPSVVLQNRSNYHCPSCSREMMIAGKIHRDANYERAEGKHIVQRYTCHGCLKEVVPVKIS